MSNATNGAVVVGIDGSRSAAQALDWAADEAERRQMLLVIAYGDHMTHRKALSEDTALAMRHEICEYGRELLADAIATVFENHASVHASTELHEMPSAEMLIKLSANASLVAVGRGDEGPIAQFVFGSTAQRVANHAHCPVVVVAPDPARPGAQIIVVGVSASVNGRQAMQFACSEAMLRVA